jgi:RNA 3'-terminal phosphate cyclase (ATP)
MGVQATLDLERWGFYPAGGGRVHVHVSGRGGAPRAISVTERGGLNRVWGIAAVTNLPSHIPQRMANRAKNVLADHGLDSRVEAHRNRGAGPGAGIFLFAEYEHAVAGFTAYGRKGVPSEQVAEAGCKQLLTHHSSGAPVDPHLADQLVLPMALAEGESRLVTSQVTQHLLTNSWAVRQFLDCEVKIEGPLGEPGVLVVQGGGRD